MVVEEDAGLVVAERPKAGGARFHANRGDLVVRNDSVPISGAADKSEVVSADLPDRASVALRAAAPPICSVAWSSGNSQAKPLSSCAAAH